MALQQKSKTSIDMTTGSIFRHIAAFAVPIFISQLIQNLYNSVDSVIVGRFVGTTALAAVTSGADVTRFLVNFFVGLASGSGVLFSRYFGAKDYDDLRVAIHTSVCFSLITGLVMVLVGIVTTPLLLEFTACAEDVVDEATEYLRIFFIGTLFTAAYNVGTGILRAVGDSRSPSKYLGISALLNTALDVLFVAVFKWGVSGAAWATVIAQALSVFLVFRRLMCTDDVYKLSLKELSVDKAMMRRIFSYGLPAAVQSGILSLSNLFAFRYINKYGSAVMAGHGAGGKVERIVSSCMSSVGLSVGTFVAQNKGANKPERCRKSTGIAFLLSTAIQVGFMAILLPLANPILRLFSSEQEVLDSARLLLFVLLPLYSFLGLQQIMANSVRGHGYPTFVMIAAIAGMIGVRQLYLAIVSRLTDSLAAIYLCFPVGWAASAVMTISFYLIKIRPELIRAGKNIEKEKPI